MSKISLIDSFERQVPEHIRNEYEIFVKFLKAYYEYLEQTQQRNLEDIRSIDKTLEEFVIRFKSELASLFPLNLTVDKRFILEKIQQFYNIRGSTESYQLLFRLLYNKDVEIFYPSTQILKPSDGKWVQDVSIFVKRQSGDLYNLEGKIIQIKTSTGKILDIFCPNVILYRNDIYEIFLDRNYYRDIDINNFVSFENNSGYIIPCPSSYRIVRGGAGFENGTLYNLRGTEGDGSLVKITKVGTIGDIQKVQVINFGLDYASDIFVKLTNKTKNLPNTPIVIPSSPLDYENQPSTLLLDNVQITSTVGNFSCNTSPGLSVGQTVEISGVSTGTGSILYYPSSLVNVQIDGTEGQFKCTKTTIANNDIVVGKFITISGTLTGNANISGYVNPKTYQVSSVDKSQTTTISFTLVNLDNTAVTTSSGTLTGLTFSLSKTYRISETNGSSTFKLIDATNLNAITTIKPLVGNGTTTGLVFRGSQKYSIPTEDATTGFFDLGYVNKQNYFYFQPDYRKSFNQYIQPITNVSTVGTSGQFSTISKLLTDIHIIGSSGQFSTTDVPFYAGQYVSLIGENSGTGTIEGYTNNKVYKVVTSSANTLSGVQITGTSGQFSCVSTTLTIGQYVTISGVFGGTGSITSYTNPKTYKISATNGTTTFTLVNVDNSAIATTIGTPTGLTYKIRTLTLSELDNTSLTTTSGTVENVLLKTRNHASLDPNQTIMVSGAIGGTGSITNYREKSISDVSITSTDGGFQCSSSPLTLLNVQITGLAGQFSCSAASSTLFVGQRIQISGSLTTNATGSITRYNNSTTYRISSTNGSTTFTIVNIDGTQVLTTKPNAANGTTTGLTFISPILEVGQYVNISGLLESSATGGIDNYIPIQGNRSGQIYKISQTDGSTTFKLVNIDNTPISTTKPTNTNGTIGGLTFVTGKAYKIITTNGWDQFNLIDADPSILPLSNVSISSTNGQFTCSASSLPLYIGQLITISGSFTGTGSIQNYASPKTYKISATNGSTSFTLITLDDKAITTTVGTTTGLLFRTNNEIVATTAGTLTNLSFTPIINDYGEYSWYADGSYVGEILSSFYTLDSQNNSIDSTSAEIEVKLGAVAVYPGYFRTNDGFISDEMYIHDGKYYQLFSYVIRVEEQLENYKNIVKSLLHPAGQNLFAEYKIFSNYLVSATPLAAFFRLQLDPESQIVDGDISEKILQKLSEDLYDIDPLPHYATLPNYANLVDLSRFLISSKDVEKPIEDVLNNFPEFISKAFPNSKVFTRRTSFQANLVAGQTDVILTSGDTLELIKGQRIIKTGGTGVFGNPYTEPGSGFENILTNVSIVGTSGQFVSSSSNVSSVKVGNYVYIQGTSSGTGNIVGYTSPKVYKINLLSTHSSGGSAFTLVNPDGSAITTVEGTLSGLTFYIKDIEQGPEISQINVRIFNFEATLVQGETSVFLTSGTAEFLRPGDYLIGLSGDGKFALNSRIDTINPNNQEFTVTIPHTYSGAVNFHSLNLDYFKTSAPHLVSGPVTFDVIDSQAFSLGSLDRSGVNLLDKLDIVLGTPELPKTDILLTPNAIFNRDGTKPADKLDIVLGTPELPKTDNQIANAIFNRDGTKPADKLDIVLGTPELPKTDTLSTPNAIFNRDGTKPADNLFIRLGTPELPKTDTLSTPNAIFNRDGTKPADKLDIVLGTPELPKTDNQITNAAFNRDGTKLADKLDIVLGTPELPKTDNQIANAVFNRDGTKPADKLDIVLGTPELPKTDTLSTPNAIFNRDGAKPADKLDIVLPKTDTQNLQDSYSDVKQYDRSLNLSNVSIVGTSGEFSCSSAIGIPLYVNQIVVISGSIGGTGNIVGYTSPKTYKISATNGSTVFTLVNLDGSNITTVVGTPTGLTYNLSDIIIPDAVFNRDGTKLADKLDIVLGTPELPKTDTLSTPVDNSYRDMSLGKSETSTPTDAFDRTVNFFRFPNDIPIPVDVLDRTVTYLRDATDTQSQVDLFNRTVSYDRTPSDIYDSSTISEGFILGNLYIRDPQLYNVTITGTSGEIAFSDSNQPIYVGQHVKISGPFSLSNVGIIGTSGEFSCSSTSILGDQEVLISGTLGGTGSIAGYTNPTSYKTKNVKLINLASSNQIGVLNTFGLLGIDPVDGLTVGQRVTTIGSVGFINSAASGDTYKISSFNNVTLSSVQCTGNTGQFSCSSTSLYVGQRIQINGTLSGISISGYINPGPKVYIISATNGSTTFTLTNIDNTAIATTVGIPSGVTFRFTNITLVKLDNSSITTPNGGTTFNNIQFLSLTFSLVNLDNTDIVTTVGTPTGLTYSMTKNGTANITGYSDPTTYKISQINTVNLSGVQVTGNSGQFSCSSTTLIQGQRIQISGTLGGTGNITGYSNPKTYKILITNGTTTFTLINLDGSAITTTVGTLTGLTYTILDTATLVNLNGSAITTTAGKPTALAYVAVDVTYSIDAYSSLFNQGTQVDTSTPSDSSILTSTLNKSDSQTQSDSSALTSTLNKSDSQTQSDSYSSLFNQGTRVDTSTPSDSSALTSTLNKSDSQTQSDSYSSVNTYNRTPTDSNTPTDSYSSLFNQGTRVDTSTPSDSSALTPTLNKSDSQSTSDSVTNITNTYNRAPVETINSSTNGILYYDPYNIDDIEVVYSYFQEDYTSNGTRAIT